ncbi:MAG: universal stress protein, partial [Cytophagaceae bacterium]
KKIICPTDFTECAENAIHYAYELAKIMGAGLTLVHVFDMPYFENEEEKRDWLENTEKDVEKVKNELELTCRRMTGLNPELKIEYLIRKGLAINEIPLMVESQKADLIVIGTKGADGFRETLGTVAAGIIEKTNCPALIIPEMARFNMPKNLVYATDLDGEESSGIEFTVGLASYFNAHVSFLSIKEEGKQVDVASAAEYAFNNLLNKLEYENLSFHMNEANHALEGIFDFVDRRRVDLIVMATYERTALERLFEKSLTKQMAYRANIPVLAVHKSKTKVSVPEKV